MPKTPPSPTPAAIDPADLRKKRAELDKHLNALQRDKAKLDEALRECKQLCMAFDSQYGPILKALDKAAKAQSEADAAIAKAQNPANAEEA